MNAGRGETSAGQAGREGGGAGRFVPGRAGRPRSPRGFSLLELVLAMLVFSLVIGAVFITARTSLALSNEVIRGQGEAMLQQAFFEMLGQRFSSLPGNTVFDLVTEDSGSHYLSELTFQDVPMSFTWGGTEKVAKAVQLAPVLRRDGFLDVVLRYYEDEILEDTADTSQGPLATEPFAEIVLLEDVRMFEWRVLDGRTLEWEWDWDIRGRMPLQVELTIAFGAQGDKIRQVFWIPPKQNPEVMMRQLQQGGGQGVAGGGGAGGGGQGGEGGGPDIEIRPGGGGGGGRPGGGGGRPGGGGGGRPGGGGGWPGGGGGGRPGGGGGGPGGGGGR